MRKLCLGQTAMHLEGPHRGHHYHTIRFEACHAALYIHEFLCAQIRTETGLRHRIFRKLKSHAGRHDTVAAMGYIGKGSPVNKSRRMLQSLDKVWLKGILKKGRHGSLGLQISAGHRSPVMSVCHYDTGQSLLKIVQIICKAKHSHDLRSHRDLKAVLPGHSVGTLSKPVHDASELPVIHIHGSLPGHSFHIYAKSVPLIYMIIQHGSQQIVGSPYGVKISGKMKVDILHGHHLGIASSGCPALYAKYRAKAWLPESQGALFSYMPESVSQAYGGGGLSLSCRGGSDSCDKHQPAVLPVLHVTDKAIVYLCFIFAIFLYISVIYTQGLGYLPYGLHPVFLSYLYIGFVSHVLPLSCLFYSRQIYRDSLTDSLSWISARICLSLLYPCL